MPTHSYRLPVDSYPMSAGGQPDGCAVPAVTRPPEPLLERLRLRLAAEVGALAEPTGTEPELLLDEAALAELFW